ncbi:non-hydrolyzing UDP-N-acetylglucosamine 2-epimerase [Rubinisphaera sp. JC750]|uniref:non-hydrolyzing UDP-N-acetylglucosamine 2-epimerase n=1 Tax=Rubinisphaera sp. JC750 TaxID=2898658 RepID=UPI001F021781|nr:UDP-N-acetylglucosamine 2-epimerase (non-hydrolyzing) [Rubinisphaera sp. JC750]
MAKIVTVVGARPQFVKAAIVSRAIEKQPELTEVIVHTGQHYDERMSEIFFNELEIPRPAFQLSAGSGSHGKQTGAMLQQLEEVLLDVQPDAVLVYGDTNSTLAGALAAVKIHIPVVHVEAGLRSFNRRMPEEVNRILVDRISSVLFCPTEISVDHLKNEGISENVHQVGDVMYDSSTFFAQQADALVSPLQDYELNRADYILVTCHRAENTDDPQRLGNIVAAINELSKERAVVLPLHPRTKHKMADFGLRFSDKVTVTEPLSYLEMIVLERNAGLILTDSGGVQKEAFVFGVPCVTIRDQTEWTETIECGANRLTETAPEAILRTVAEQLLKSGKLPDAGPYYGNGNASRDIAQGIASFLEQNKG